MKQSREKKFPIGRGGAWGFHGSRCRGAFRYYFPPGFRYDDWGFRLALKRTRKVEENDGAES